MNAAEQKLIEVEQRRADLVYAYHVLDLEGQGSGLGGHVTARVPARVPGEDAFWSHPFGLAFEEVTLGDLLKLDFKLNRLEGSGRVNPTLIFHSRIYQTRPDVNCVVHTHANHVTALTATGAPLELVTQIASVLQDDTAALDEYEGLVVDQGGGDDLARALGSKRALLLKNHGLISVGASIAAAVTGAIILEYAAKIQLKVMAAGPVSALPRAAAEDAKRFLTTDSNTQDRWAMLTRRAARARPKLVPAVPAALAVPAIPAVSLAATQST